MSKSLSTIASTAAFDKNPQSKERGITLDLGFSSFQVDSPLHISDAYNSIQYTLVDCPGHGKYLLIGIHYFDIPSQEALNTWRGRLQHFLQLLYNQKIQKVILI